MIPLCQSDAQTDATTPEGVDWGLPRAKTIEWHDPARSARWAQQLDGLKFIQAVVDGVIPAPPIASLMNMRFMAAEKGSVVCELDPDESMYNPIGGIHGGTMCTLLDTVVGCAVHTTLPAGVGYTSVEIKVNFIRAATQHSGTLIATGTVKKGGRRIAFAEGEVTDIEGRVVATATSTLLLFENPGAAA
ncbi:MAG: PaaI family thioesterase [Kineosporiaceae bacterium]|nr:PaaI family thioesterase [Aeromicrobium sp.]